MDLYRVKGNGCHLVWPTDFQGSGGKSRGFEGYVVDLDAPLERVWCSGQMHKLEPAPDAGAPTPFTHPVARQMIAAHLATKARRESDEAARAAEREREEKENPVEPNADPLEQDVVAARARAKAKATAKAGVS